MMTERKKYLFDETGQQQLSTRAKESTGNSDEIQSVSPNLRIETRGDMAHIIQFIEIDILMEIGASLENDANLLLNDRPNVGIDGVVVLADIVLFIRCDTQDVYEVKTKRKSYPCCSESCPR